MAEQERKLDETVPGGYFLGTDGVPHDAEGKPVKAVSEAKLEAAQEEAAKAAGDASGGPARTLTDEVQFASAAAKDAAEAAKLTDADFATVKPSSENGYTKGDVVALVDAKQG